MKKLLFDNVCDMLKSVEDVAEWAKSNIIAFRGCLIAQIGGVAEWVKSNVIAFYGRYKICLQIGDVAEWLKAAPC